MIGRLKDLTINRDGSQNVTVTIEYDFREMYDKLKDDDVDIEIKQKSKRKTLDANAYLWHICSEIAKASSKFSNDGKEDVYREAIRAKGEFVQIPIRQDAVDTFVSRWSQKGTGWFADIIDDYYTDDEYSDFMGDKESKYKLVHVYFGSSTYDSLALSKIIDYVVNIANDLGIPTMTRNELDKTLASWQKKVDKHGQVNHTDK